MIKRIFLLLLCFTFCGFCYTSGAFAADLDPEEVNQAIDRGVDYLKSRQKANGTWEEGSSRSVGLNALCTLALLNSGCTTADPAVAKSLATLRKHTPETVRATGTYVVYGISLQTMVFCTADPQRDTALIRRNVQWLEEVQMKKPDHPNQGGWSYGQASDSDSADVSNAQFAVLALYEAERAGVKCKPETWIRAKRYWETLQGTDGGWGYTYQDRGISGSRVSAGVASLLITGGMVDQGAARVDGNNIFCCLDPDAKSESGIRRGFDWLAKRFLADDNPGLSRRYVFYYLYGIERVGRMTGQRFIGQHDWYREGTEYLVLKHKARAGAALKPEWKGFDGSEDELVATSFALLFLSRGRRPILLSKIQYEGDGSWNAHPNDVNHLTQFVEKQFKLDLTWQTTHWEYASVEDLLQSPVLYICGNTNPLPRDRERADKIVEKLRAYLDQGGFIFAEALGDDVSFDSGFREMMRRVLPEEEYALRLLERSHPIWDAEITVPPSQVRPIEGIDFGCRTSVVYVPSTLKRGGIAFQDDEGERNIVTLLPAASANDTAQTHLTAQRAPMSVSRYKPSLSCLWEITKLLDRGDPYAKSVQEQIDAGLAIGCNVLAYATEREFQSKLAREQEYKVKDPKAEANNRGIVAVGLIEHGGGSRCAPRAIPRLMEGASEKMGTPVSSTVENIALTNPDLFHFPILFMHGRNAFRFTEEERAILKQYIERGGFLFVNSICASAAFTKSFEEEMNAIFPDDAFTPIPLDDPLFSELYSGKKIEKLEMKNPQRSQANRMEASKRMVEPELRGVRIGDRWGVVFSPYDVSCALEKLSSIECKGYTSASAFDLGLQVLLYAMEH